MTIEDLLVAMRDRLDRVAIPGVMSVNYPPLDHVPASPCIMLRQARELPATVSRNRAYGQTIDVQVEVVILVAAGLDQQREEARLDPLIAPVIDTFDPQAWGQDIADMLGVKSNEIDHVFNDAQVVRMPVEFGGTYCYGAYITFDAVIRRQPKPLPLKEVQP